MKARGLVLEGKRFWSPDGVAPPASLPDVSRFGNNGTFTNNPTWVQLPSGLWVLNFVRASSQYISIPTDPSLDIRSGGFSLMCWFNTVEDSTQQGLIARVVPVTWNTYYYLSINASRGLTGEFVANGGGGLLINITFVFLNNIWSHGALTYDGPGGSLRLYLNTVEIGNDNAPAQGSVPAINQPLSIGAISPVDAPQYFGGQIGLPIHYNYALSPDQINAHYAAERTLFGA